MKKRFSTAVALSLWVFTACHLGVEEACEGRAEDMDGPVAAAVRQAGGHPVQGKTTTINCSWDWNFPSNIQGSAYATVQSGEDTWGLALENGEWVVVADSKQGCDGLTGKWKDTCKQAD